MIPCNEHRADILRYLDNELSGRKLEQFLAHLESCADCRTQLDEEQALSDILRRSRPLYSAPSELRDRVSVALNEQRSAGKISDPAGTSLRQFVKQLSSGFVHAVPRWTIPAAAVLVIAACLIIAPDFLREVRAASYVTAAVSTHSRYITGDLPLEIRSDSQESVTAWLSGRLAFPFRLPDSRSDTGRKPTYRLVGARLVDYKGEHAALVAYEEAEKNTISLLVADSRTAVVAGGDEVRAGNLVFHYCNESGFKVITWSAHGLSYALVSKVNGSPQASCLVCHQTMADRDHFKH